MNNYLSRKKACIRLGIHYHTLYKLKKNNLINFIKINNRTLYNVDEFVLKQNKNIKKNICYCRVSSLKQKEDLERQVLFMKKMYKNYEIITDIGSGLNMNRKGFIKIIDYAINCEINNLVITYKDRLMRFGHELVERLIQKYSNGKIIVIHKNNNETPMEELSKDIIAIMNIYVAKMNGMRKYKNKL